MRNLLLALTCLGVALGSARGGAVEVPDLDDPKVQYELGMSHLTSQGGAKKDPVEAVTWLRKAALQGHADAQVQLGICYQQGFGIVRDLVQALGWFRRAAEQGNARGQLQVGLAYQRGRGVAPDSGQAMVYLRKAAESRHPKAQLELGVAYREGRGVEADPVAAAFWLRLAADSGSLAANMMSAGARKALSDAQRADLDERLASWRRKHPAPAPESDSSSAAPSDS